MILKSLFLGNDTSSPSIAVGAQKVGKETFELHWMKNTWAKGCFVHDPSVDAAKKIEMSFLVRFFNLVLEGCFIYCGKIILNIVD
ncbi:MAG: hypothetical protein AAF985_13875 [Bacteroidota bacterium]